MPASPRFFEPRICTTVEGSSASLDMPPAAPTSFAAVAAPRTCLGRVSDMSRKGSCYAAVAAPTMATTLGATIAC